MSERLADKVPEGSGRRDRLRVAWELSKPVVPAVAELDQGYASGWQGRIERGQEFLASVFFFATFLGVLIEATARYFGHPVIWALELPTYFFLWAFGFAASLSDWTDDQLAFDLVVDKLPDVIRAGLRRLTNLMFVVLFVLVLPGTVSSLAYESHQPNTGLPLSHAWGNAGVFGVFALGALLRARLVVIDILPTLRRNILQRVRRPSCGPTRGN